MSSKPRFPISGMNRRFAPATSTTPATPTTAATSTTSATSATPALGDIATPLARRGIAISGAGRRLGISGMRRPLLDTQTPSTTPDDTNEGLP
jgi:hypothetical protein